MAGFSDRLVVVVVWLSVIIATVVGYVPVNERPVRIDQPGPSLSRRRPPVRHQNPVSNPVSGISTRSTSTANYPFLAMGSVNRRISSVESRSSVLERGQAKLRASLSELEDQVADLQAARDEAYPPHQEAMSELLAANMDLQTRLVRLEADNQELREFLQTFEQFFHRLMSDDPVTFNPAAAPAQRLSRLHQYLGNAEAELIDVTRQTVSTPNVQNSQVADEWGAADAMASASSQGIPRPANQGIPRPGQGTPRPIQDMPRPSQIRPMPRPGQSMPPTSHRIPIPSHTMTMSAAAAAPPRTAADRESTSVHLSNQEADHLATVLIQLESRNNELANRLQTLERQAAEGGPGGAQASGAASTVNSNAVTEELLNKVEILEQVVALQASSILDNAPSDDGGIVALGSSGPNGPIGARGTSPGSQGHKGAVVSTRMKQEDLAIMTDVLEETRTSKSSSRKSAFSVARTTSLFGTNEHQRVEFDHVFVNKGRDFDQRNSTFVCERAGFYFISFNLRSYDGLYLGVSLMKNNDVISAVYTDAHHRNVMEGQSLILHLEPGDSLYLLLGKSPEFGFFSNHRKYVTFSGYMIYSGY